jgi:hypothetical protein
MKHFKLLVMGITITLLSACTTAQRPMIHTEYVTIEIPVVYKIERPDRPKLLDKAIPIYLSELLTYTGILELIIDSHGENDGL